MKLPYIAAPFAFVLLLLSGTVNAQAETDIVYKKVMSTQTIQCGYAEWPPFMTIDPNTQQVSGLLKELWDIIGKKLELKIEWSKPLGWGEITEAVKTGKVDAFCVGVWPDAGRSKNLLLSRPVFYSPVYLYARYGDDRFDHKYELLNDQSYTVAGQEGDITATVLGLKYPVAKKAHVPPMAQQGEILLNVISKKADVALVDVPYADDFMAHNPNKLKRVAGPPVSLFPVNIPLPLGEIQLKNMVDGALNDLINDGTIGSLIQKWHAKETYAPTPDLQIPEGK